MQDKEAHKNNEQALQLVVFELESEEYAFEINKLKEIIPIPQITVVPNAQECVKGIFNLRGKLILAINLKSILNLHSTNTSNQKHVVIAEKDSNLFGLMVDEVKDVIIVKNEQIQPNPELVSNKIHGDYIKGVVVIDKNQTKTKNTDKKDTNSSEKNTRLIIILSSDTILEKIKLDNLENKVQNNTEQTKEKQ